MSILRILAAMALASLALLTSACGPLRADPQIEAAARSAYAEMHDGQFDALIARATPQLHTPDAKARLARIRAMQPLGQPRSIKTVGWGDFRADSGNETVHLTQEYDYGDQVVLVRTSLVRPSAAAPWQVEALHTNVATRAQLAAAAPHLSLDTPIQKTGFLIATLLSPLLMLAALTRVVLTKGLKRKWIWGLLAFVGVCSFHMNWTTGAVAAQWISVQFIGAGISRADSLFAPWIMTCTFPLGALLILAGVVARPKKPKPEPKVRIELADS